MKHSLTSAVCLALASQIACQTFVVDAAGGPGTAYLDLPNAIAGVPSGAVLIVRPGSYSPFTVDAKAVTILGDVGAQVVGTTGANQAITIQNLAANQAATVRGLELHAPNGSMTTQLAGCQGPIMLEGLLSTPSTIATALAAYGCDQVFAQSCDFSTGAAAIYLVDCGEVTCIDCTANVTLGAAIVALDGTLNLVDCEATGGIPGVNSRGPAVLVGDATLRLNGSCRLEGGPPFGTYPMGPAIDQDGGSSNTVLRRSSDSVLIGAVHSGIATTNLPTCALTTAGGDLGGSVTATLRGTSGNLGALLIGLPAQPTPLPGFADTTWLDPASAAGVGLTVFGAPLLSSLTIPQNPTLLGTTFAWQGITLDAIAGWLLSNPAWFAIR